MTTMTAAALRSELAKRMTEKVFQEQHVVPAFKRAGFDPRLISHAWRSDHSAAGLPDILAIRGRELHVVELKREGKNATTDQQSWLDAFSRVELVVVHGVWRPSDIGRLDDVLTGVVTSVDELRGLIG